MSDNKPKVAVYCRVGNKDQQSEPATASVQKKQLLEFCNHMGYDYVDRKLVANATEAEMIKSVFKKFEEYTENPPKVLVDSVLEMALENGEDLCCEDAKQRVSYSEILAFIANELNVEFDEKLTMFKSSRYVGRFEQGDPRKVSDQIVPKELWSVVQDKLRRNQ